MIYLKNSRKKKSEEQVLRIENIFRNKRQMCYFMYILLSYPKCQTWSYFTEKEIFKKKKEIRIYNFLDWLFSDQINLQNYGAFQEIWKTPYLLFFCFCCCNLANSFFVSKHMIIYFEIITFDIFV